jgi:hypothetical protein
MRKIIVLASAAAMAMTMPMLAHAQGQGKGKGQAAQAQQRGQSGVKTQTRQRSAVQTQSTRGQTRARSNVETVDRDHYWVRQPDGRWTRTRAADRSGHPHGCPPGLANRNPACVPPGQARRMFDHGQRVPDSYREWSEYRSIPERYRSRVPEGYRYIYRDDTVYVVNPRTRLVDRIIHLLN